ncbi:ERAD-associated E3 ubiquitin-protein ligase doa10 [Neolecta irregularis DAH-3]|uniref:RING-type E3 ubiquitin transferase n=1 Tax=Neolecta irregularis (strain DAH-3) TaxID=1198029 RepID=A0A1U7LVC9_NEOID|nr:ERAD-associated E3 ubiquitin-protein ligase doa10 [Neolecta irregularis DAH-3]|eukprot:OLL26630.1 ERAD-associated E3 ubiquitin-protein ligase doa10 [Neolecta irregularis DAH-3]
MAEPLSLPMRTADLNSGLNSEEELCRVCRSEATADDPLFHPCKCSGSIKHVHESCLKEWFKHSGKKQCELCKTQFKFTKVFSSEMPTGNLPLPILASRIFARVKRNLTLWFRIAVVGCVWLLWLPWTTRVSWRGLFFLTDFLFGSTNQPSSTDVSSSVLNATLVPSNDSTMGGSRLFELYTPRILSNLTSSPAINHVLADCFEGQAMTASILCIFMMIFLLREYIEQHVPNAFDERPLEEPHARQPEILRNPEPEHGRVRVPPAQRELQLIPRVAVQRAPPPHVPLEHDSEGDWTTDEDDEEPQGDDRPFAGFLRSSNPDGLRPQYLAMESNILRSTTPKPRIDTETSNTGISTSRPSIDSTPRENRTVYQFDRVLEKRPMVSDFKGKDKEKEKERLVIGPDDAVEQPFTESNDASLRNFSRTLGNRMVPSVDELNRTSLSASSEGNSEENTQSSSRLLDFERSSFLPDQSQDTESDRLLALRTAKASFDYLKDGPLATEQRASTDNSHGLSIAFHADDHPIHADETNSDHPDLEGSSSSIHRPDSQSSPVANADQERPISNQIDGQANQPVQLGNAPVPFVHRDPLRHLPGRGGNIRNDLWADIENAARNNNLRNRQADGNDADGPVRLPEPEEEEFDGVLELIGLQGPFLGLFQNSIFASILMIAMLGLCVFFPYIWGKTFLLLFVIQANPLIFILSIPLIFAKLVWDFAFDLAVLSFSNVLCILDYAGRTTITPLGLFSQSLANVSSNTRFSEWSMYLASSSWKRLARRFLDTPKILWQPSIINKLVPLRQKMTFQIVLSVMKEMTMLDKLLSVGMGYLLFIGLTQLYLRRTRPFISSPGGIAVERALRKGLHQTGSLAKICIVLSIELFLFPLYSGIILDLCFLPLFENMDPLTRWYATLTFPGTSIFLHWLVGTFYMFHLSLFVSMSREIIRPGVLYFIRDPNNHEFNPIQEIVRRPFITHIRKIAISAVIYTVLLASCVGSLTYFIRFFVPGVFPLQWANKEFPVFDLPLDLLFYHMALPLSVHFFRPGNMLKSLWRWWFRFISSQLRLTSFMFNEHVPQETGHYVRKTLKARILLKTSSTTEVDYSADVYYVRDGGFMRVPKRDSIALMRHRGFRMLLPVDENNRRLDGQSDEGYDENDFQVVYTPPNFYRRITAFVFCVWLFTAATSLSFTVGPLLFGRYFFRWAFGLRAQLSDVYAVLCGFYAAGTTIIAADYTNQFLKKAIEYKNGFQQRPFNPTDLIRQAQATSYRLLKVFYLVFITFIVFPVLLAFIINFYLVVPVQTYLDVESSIQVMHTWILGVVYVKLGIRILLLTDGRMTGRRLREVVQNGWTDPDVGAANRWFVIPLGAAMITALIVPLSIGWIANHTIFRGASGATSDKVYRYSYPIALGVLMGILFAQVIVGLMHRWTDGIREEIWLVGERLHNIDDEDIPSRVISEGNDI